MLATVTARPTPTPNLQATIDAAVAATVTAAPTPILSGLVTDDATAAATATATTPTLIPGCAADYDCPLGTICQGGVCIYPRPTPTTNAFLPAVDPNWNLPSVGYMGLTCTDFHPGVQPPSGPSRWYVVTAQITNISGASRSLAVRLQLVGDSGEVLFESVSAGVSLSTFTNIAFSERFDLQSVPANSLCYVTFSESGFAREGSGIGIVELRQVLAP